MHSSSVHIIFGFVFSLSLFYIEYSTAQPICASEIGAIYGTPDGNEHGFTLATDPNGGGFYIGGIKDDSALIVKMNFLGEVTWARTFDIVPGESDNVGCLIVDSDYNLVFSGIAGSLSSGGSVFVGKYDPAADELIWSNEIVSGWTRNYHFEITEKGTGGNYLIINNPHNDPAANNDAEIHEINRSNGTVVAGNSQVFSFGSSEQLAEIRLHGGALYAVGRYTDGGSSGGMRHTLTKLNQSTYDAIWTKLGHIAGGNTARLYGTDLLILNDELYSCYQGDPAGTSTTNTKVYIQKTDINGNLQWLKQYEFPGSNDVCYEMISSDGGIVMLVMKRASPRELILFKIDYAGAVLWGKSYQFPTLSNVDVNQFGQHQLIEAGGFLIFTGFGTSSSAGSEMIIVRADLTGQVNIPCVTTQSITVTPIVINTPVFYTVTPATPNAPFSENSPFAEPVEAFIIPNEECYLSDTLYGFVEATICIGESYEGYSVPGTYVDNFTTPAGCDSIRTLNLTNYPPSGSTEHVTICLGQSYEGHSDAGSYTETYTNSDGCDSIHMLELTVIPLETEIEAAICEGQSYAGYTDTGFYIDTIQGPPGDCDTIRYLSLAVQEATAVTMAVDICAGESYEGYTSSGIYEDVFTDINGCDSVRILSLEVIPGDETQFTLTICQGNSYEGYTTTGTYTDDFINVSGCDSIRTLVLTVTDFISTSIEAVICEGDTYEGYSSSGMYVDDFISHQGCDSIRTLHLTVTDEILTTIVTTICEGQTYEGYSIAGVYVDAFVSVNGCDSLRTLQLSFTTCSIPCETSTSNIYGITDRNEHGQCLVTAPENDAVYVAAKIEDSTLLIKIDLNGNWIWSRIIDAIPNEDEIPAGILVDAEGMIAVSGTGRNSVTGGSLYAFRYDPLNHQLLWAKEYTHSPNDFNFDIEEKGNGGNYLLANQATYYTDNYNDAGIAEIDKLTGNLVSDFQKNYHLFGTETLNELIYHNDYVYGIGRYKDSGPTNLQMRHTLTKLDPANGDQLWVKMGHQPNTNEGRLYGTDMLIDNDEIISLYSGDPDGHSTMATEVFIQRTDLDGNLIWLNTYDIPGNNSWSYDVIKSGNGYVAYTSDGSTGEHYLFKVDQAGAVMWARKLVFFTDADIYYGQRGNQLLVEAGNKLVLTGGLVTGSGDADMFIIITDLEGNLSSPCMESVLVMINAIPVANPIFYAVTPELKIPDTMSFGLNPLVMISSVPALSECEVTDTLFTEETVTICSGTDYNGYTEPGDYIDVFTTADGCDSAHTLHLLVIICEDLCFDTLTSIYGEPGIRENGLCITAASAGDGYYILGRRADGVLLLKFGLQDQLQWSHSIDAVANKREYPVSFLVDSDGMIAVTGMATDNPAVGGTIFIFRFNPLTRTLLWSSEIPSAYDADRVQALSQNGPGGNYLISTNPNEFSSPPYNDFQLIEINPVNGSPDPQSNIYKLGNSNYIFDLHRQGAFLYGVGRYSLGVGADLLRHTMVKLDATTLNTVWTKLSHTPADVDTRIYGFDMVIDNGFIYSGIYGDPDGTSTSQTEIFIQKTTIDGQLIWFKTYNLPLNTDFGYELIKSGDGFVVFANQRNATGALYLFKVDSNGDVVWAREYEISRNPNTVTFAIGGEQLIALGDDLVFTASVDDPGGAEDILVLHIDSLGFTDAPCVIVNTFSLQDEDVPNPIVYDVTIQELNWPVSSQIQPIQHQPVTLLPALGCSQSTTHMTAIDTTVCHGTSFESYTLPGTYQDTFQTVDGCDSLRTITLSVVAPTQILDIQLCAGHAYDSYTVTGSYVDTLQGSNGACDTVRYLDLFIHLPLLTFINAAICEGDNFLGYTESGTYADTFVSVNGCDSVRTLQLTMQNVLTTTEQVTICEGESYQGYSVAGIYIDTFTTQSGCDSIRLLTVAIDTPQLLLDVAICEGGSYLGYTASGVYTDILPGVLNDCDTLRTLTLQVTAVLQSAVAVSICEGEQYEGYTTSGTYIDTFITSAGCDSIRTLTLTVAETAYTNVNQSICFGESYAGYEATGIYLDTFQSATGCDSIRTLDLLVSIVTKQVDATICEGQSYEQYSSSGTYSDTIQAVTSLCDTLRTLNLSVINIAEVTIDQVICDGDSFEGYSQTGYYTDTLISALGCDSIRELNLVKLDPIESAINASICDPETPFTLPAGMYIDTFLSARGCDSVRTLILDGTTVYIPNVFSPNDDGINDVFNLTSFPTVDLDLEYFAIFDRFGNMAYETTTWPVNWKGDDASGDRFQPAVFAYIFIYQCGGQNRVEHGNITLVK